MIYVATTVEVAVEKLFELWNVEDLPDGQEGATAGRPADSLSKTPENAQPAGSQNKNEEDRRSRSDRHGTPTWQLFDTAVVLLAGIVAVAEVLRHPPMAMIVAATGFFVAFTAAVLLQRKLSLSKRGRRIAALVVLVGSAIAVVALNWPTTSNSGSDQRRIDPPATEHRNAPAPSGPISPFLLISHRSLGARARDLAVGNGKLLTGTAAGVASFNPATGNVTTNRFGAPNPVDDVATRGGRVAFASAGTGYLANVQKHRWTRRPIRFSTRSGCVTITAVAVWLCNRPYSKVERVDLTTGARTSLSVPGRPTGIASATGSLWVRVAEGWIVRFDAEGHELARYRIETGAGPIAVAFGFLWIGHDEGPFITRLPLRSPEAESAPLRLGGGTPRFVATAAGMWVSRGRVLYLVDSEKFAVQQRLTLPEPLAGLVAQGQSVWGVGTETGRLFEIRHRTVPSAWRAGIGSLYG